MKKILIFLITIIFVVSQTLTPSQREELLKNRLRQQKFIAECILNNETSSQDFKNRIVENKNKGLSKVFYPTGNKLERSDREVIRICKRKYYEKMKEERLKNKENNNNESL